MSTIARAAEFVVPMAPDRRVRVRVAAEADAAPPTPMEVERWEAAELEPGEALEAIGILHRSKDAEFFMGACEAGSAAETRQARPVLPAEPVEGCFCLLCAVLRKIEERKGGSDE